VSSLYQKERDLNKWRTYLDWILILLILFFAFTAIILVPAFLTASELDRVPYALHSILNANYGIDPLGLKFFQVKPDIIAQVIADQNGFMPGDGSENPLLPGTPTVDTLQPTSTPAPTDGTINPTASNNPSPTNTANLTPGVTELSTPGGEITQQATQTPGSNSKTATPTHSVATRRPTSTTISGSTSVPPTLTSTTRSPGTTSIAPTQTAAPTTQSPTSTTASPTRTSTPTERPTSTSLPPTRTQEPTELPTNTPRPTRPPDPYPPPYP
jgi:hypothetical protein